MEVRRRASADGFGESVLERARITPDVTAFIGSATFWIQAGFLGTVAAVLAARFIGEALRRNGLPLLTYPDGRRLEVPPGASVLDVSRANGIPHASVCGGRGRCSPCRVRIGRGLEQLPPPSAEERAVLDRQSVG